MFTPYNLHKLGIGALLILLPVTTWSADEVAPDDKPAVKEQVSAYKTQVCPAIKDQQMLEIIVNKEHSQGEGATVFKEVTYTVAPLALGLDTEGQETLTAAIIEEHTPYGEVTSASDDEWELTVLAGDIIQLTVTKESHFDWDPDVSVNTEGFSEVYCQLHTSGM